MEHPPDEREEYARAQRECMQQADTIRREMQQLLHEKGALEQQHALYCAYQKELQQCEGSLKNIENDIADYQIIAQALGKEGIQAFLIEQAIPEIEQEANTILAKLTDNQAHIMIDSVRDLKSGGTKETLDIKISDA